MINLNNFTLEQQIDALQVTIDSKKSVMESFITTNTFNMVAYYAEELQIANEVMLYLLDGKKSPVESYDKVINNALSRTFIIKYIDDESFPDSLRFEYDNLTNIAKSRVDAYIVELSNDEDNIA